MIKDFGWVFLFFSILGNAEAAPSLNRQVVAESASFVFSPNFFSENDFEITGSSSVLKASFVPKSFEWIRISPTQMFPRARVRFERIDSPNEKMLIKYEDSFSWSESSVALVSSPTDSIVVFDRDGQSELGRFGIRFKPKRAYRNKVVLDQSCTPDQVEAVSQKLNKTWVEMSCKRIEIDTVAGSKPTLEITLFWDGDQSTVPVEIEGQALTQDDSRIYTIRIQPDQKPMHLKRGEESFVIQHKLPEVIHRFSLSAGVGPYLNTLEEPTGVRARWVPFGTLYASYMLSESVRLASFWAFPVDTRFQTDVGLYVISEQFKLLDQRLWVNLLLGAHIIYFKGVSQGNLGFSAPQGIELSYKDFLLKRKSLSVGGFFYPQINDRSYVNAWIRFGSSSIFYELNYIFWREPFKNLNVSSKSFGFSVGFPLFKAF